MSKKSLKDMLASSYEASEDSGERDYKRFAQVNPDTDPPEDNMSDSGLPPQVQEYKQQQQDDSFQQVELQAQQQQPVQQPNYNPNPYAQQQQQQSNPYAQQQQQPQQQPRQQYQQPQQPVQQPRPAPQQQSNPYASSSSSGGFGGFGRTKVSTNPVVNVEFINKIITIGDRFRELSSSVQNTMLAFLERNTEEYQNTSIAEVVHATLNTDHRKMKGLINVVKLKKEEAVSRAFSLIALPESELEMVSSLVAVFSPDGYTPEGSIRDKVQFCRKLEKGLEALPVDLLEHFEPISEILKVALGEDEDENKK